MRNERQIANEIEVRRANLEHDLGQLRALVDDKLDVVRRARETLDEKRQRLYELRNNARTKIAQRPMFSVGVAFALGALLALMRGR